MKIDHIAIWVTDIEAMKAFYIKYFGAACNDKYVNSVKKFQSYFLSFNNAETRIEIMQRDDITAKNNNAGATLGLTHFAMAVGSRKAVDKLTERLRKDGYTIAGEPRTTGDGYYESVVLDPEGNPVEITV